MRVAAVDVGSNTVHVLVADAVGGKLTPVAHHVEMTELGTQVAKSGAIGARGKLVLAALGRIMDKAAVTGYKVLVAGATEAVRQARDGEAFVVDASRQLGVPMQIIPGRREAELSFLGAASTHATRRGWVLADLGGASTEVVIGHGKALVSAVSLSIGSGVLASAHLSDPPDAGERAKLRQAALRQVILAPEGEVERLVATGGTAANLPMVLSRRTPPPILTTAALLTCEHRLDSAHSEHLAQKFGLDAARIRAMRAGLEVLLLLLDWYGLAALSVSHQGLRDGMILAYLDRGDDWWR